MTAATASFAAPTQALQRRFDALRQQAPELAEAIGFYAGLVPLLRAAQAGVEPLVFERADVQRKLAAGLPLLVGEALPLDGVATGRLIARLCQLIETNSRTDPEASLRRAAARAIRQACQRGQLDLPALCEAAAIGAGPQIELAAARLSLDAGLLQVLLRYSLRPVLRACAQANAAAADLSRWRRGLCPWCGSPPVLAEVQGKEGARHLRCGQCAGDWPYPRVQCAYCGNHDHHALGRLAVEGEDNKYAVQTCDACQSYLKVVTTFEPASADGLMLDDLATLHLDALAQQRGFSRAGLA